MTTPDDFSYTRYLSAKKSVDDRALNHQVFEAMAQALKPRQEAGPVAFLEVGCGIGTMVERLWDWGIFTNACYAAVDLSPANIAAAAARLSDFALSRGLQVADFGENNYIWTCPQRILRLGLEALDVFDLVDRETGRGAWDVILAHAFLDLVDLGTALPRLFALLKPGGCFYFTLNFDGRTDFFPTLNGDLDARIEALYHGTMDARRVGGQPSGGSRTGRFLGNLLPEVGGRLLAAGASDWVVFPGPGGYPDDEAYFLHYIVHTVTGALREHPLLEEEALQEWAARRRQHIDQGQLVYVAHQLDFFGIKE
jgi:SAM-dependent methyltransferase